MLKAPEVLAPEFEGIVIFREPPPDAFVEVSTVGFEAPVRM
jgi:hypothetical protein